MSAACAAGFFHWIIGSSPIMTVRRAEIQTAPSPSFPRFREGRLRECCHHSEQPRHSNESWNPVNYASRASARAGPRSGTRPPGTKLWMAKVSDAGSQSRWQECRFCWEQKSAKTISPERAPTPPPCNVSGLRRRVFSLDYRVKPDNDGPEGGNDGIGFAGRWLPPRQRIETPAISLCEVKVIIPLRLRLPLKIAQSISVFLLPRGFWARSLKA